VGLIADGPHLELASPPLSEFHLLAGHYEQVKTQADMLF
jgi:hypothetical protein